MSVELFSNFIEVFSIEKKKTELKMEWTQNANCTELDWNDVDGNIIIRKMIFCCMKKSASDFTTTHLGTELENFDDKLLTLHDVYD